MTKPISTRKFTTTSSHWQRTVIESEEPAALGPQWRILCMVLGHAPTTNLPLSGLPLQPGASPPGGPAVPCEAKKAVTTRVSASPAGP